MGGLTGETLEKATKIIEEHAPKIIEARERQDATLTPAQREYLTKARREATQAIRDGAKKPGDLTGDLAAAFKSLNVPAAQKAKHDAAQQGVLDAMKAQNEALRPLLTREQQIKMAIPPLPKTK